MGSDRVARLVLRGGFTLLELVAVVTLLGILAAVVMSRLDHDTVQNLAAGSEARRIALDLHQARRRAISTGDNHYVLFSPAAANAAQYAVYRRDPGGDEVVEALRDVHDGVTVSASHAEAEFSFEGAALAAYTVVVTGPDKAWTVSVISATGAISVAEN